ncbi:unnamed protein product, partial [Effrenium voratum]
AAVGEIVPNKMRVEMESEVETHEGDLESPWLSDSGSDGSAQGSPTEVPSEEEVDVEPPWTTWAFNEARIAKQEVQKETWLPTWPPLPARPPNIENITSVRTLARMLARREVEWGIALEFGI